MSRFLYQSLMVRLFVLVALLCGVCLCDIFFPQLTEMSEVPLQCASLGTTVVFSPPVLNGVCLLSRRHCGLNY